MVNLPQLQEISVFYPSLASVTTMQILLQFAFSKIFVSVHRDGIPPEDLASFPCTTAGTSLPTTESISTVLTETSEVRLDKVNSRGLPRT